MTRILVRRYQLVRLYLGWHAFTATGFGLELVAAPRRLISGPSTVTIYRLASPRWWGVLFIVLGVVICAPAIRWPRQCWRFGALGLGVVQTCWAAALFAPLATVGTTNLLASAPWIALAVTTGLVAHRTIHEELTPSAGKG